MTRSGWSRRAVVAVALAVALPGRLAARTLGGRSEGERRATVRFPRARCRQEFVVASMVEVRLVGFGGQGEERPASMRHCSWSGSGRCGRTTFARIP